MDDYGFAVRGDLSVTPAKYRHITFATVCLAPPGSGSDIDDPARESITYAKLAR
jgi:hypothetical protein